MVRQAPAVATPRRAAAKMAWRAACSIQTNRPSPAWRSSRSGTPAGKVFAGRDFRTVAGNKDRADLADPVWAQGSGGPPQSWRLAPRVGVRR